MNRNKWLSVLIEASSNVERIVRNQKNKSDNMQINELKELLDQAAQEAILSILKKHKIKAHIVSEEGDLVLGEKDFTIVLDPIDGTTNMARNLRPSVTSLAVSESNKASGLSVGVIKNLYTGDLYHAIKNHGAWLNFRKIKTAEPTNLKKSIVSMDISKKPKLEVIKYILSESDHIRELGCSAMSLSYLASGSIDLHLDIRGTLRITDVAAGLLILKEAGGVYAIDGEFFSDVNLERHARLELVAASSNRVLQEAHKIIYGKER